MPSAVALMPSMPTGINVASRPGALPREGRTPRDLMVFFHGVIFQGPPIIMGPLKLQTGDFSHIIPISLGISGGGMFLFEDRDLFNSHGMTL